MLKTASQQSSENLRKRASSSLHKAHRTLQQAQHNQMTRAVAPLLFLAVALLLAAGPAAAARKLLTCPSTSGCKNWGFPYNSASTAQLGDPGKDCGSGSVSGSRRVAKGAAPDGVHVALAPPHPPEMMLHCTSFCVPFPRAELLLQRLRHL